MQIGPAKASPAPNGPGTKQTEYVPLTNTAPLVEEPKDVMVEGRAELDKAVNKINKTMELYSHDIRFAIHEQTHQVMIQVVDKKTDEVISEMPPSQILDMVAAFQEMVGLIVDEKV